MNFFLTVCFRKKRVKNNTNIDERDKFLWPLLTSRMYPQFIDFTKKALINIVFFKLG